MVYDLLASSAQGDRRFPGALVYSDCQGWPLAGLAGLAVMFVKLQRLVRSVLEVKCGVVRRAVDS